MLPKILPLEWTQANGDAHPEWRARSIVGEYTVGFDDGWYVQLEDGLKWEWEAGEDPRAIEGPELPRRVCQAHYESTVLSAFDLSTEAAQRWVLGIPEDATTESVGGSGGHMRPTGNRHIDKAIDHIDAAMFSGDALTDINAALRLQKYLHRWERGLLKKFVPEGQCAEYDPTAY